MRKGKPTFYWDANIFLAWLKDENRKAGEMQGLSEVVSEVTNNRTSILTSVLTRGEILESSLPPNARDVFDLIFQRPNIVRADLTIEIAQLGSRIRDYYNSEHKKLKLADAQHLATAIAYRVDEFHTFDEDLIPLSGNVAGNKLIICKPKPIQGVLFT